MNATAIFIAAIVILLLLGVVVIPRFMVKRAMGRVVQAFRAQNATNLKNARTLEELGLQPRGFIDGMFRGRDYKPFALDLLRRAEIILTTEDGKLYLSEDRLSRTELTKRR